MTRYKVDGHVRNSGSAIPNRRRSQTGRIWSYDQSGHQTWRSTIGRSQTGCTIGRAADHTTSRLVVRPVATGQDQLYDRTTCRATGLLSHIKRRSDKRQYQ